MARSRNIKPGFFKNYELADAGMAAQLLFAGLWCLADNEGRLEDKPRLIKAEIFPYYQVDINRELTVMERLKFIYRFQLDGLSIIEIINFKKHQNPHHTEKKSTLPSYEKYKEYCKNNIIETNTCSNNGELTVNSPLYNGGNPADSLIPDSLIPDSSIPDSSIPDQKKCANAHKEKTKTSSSFDEFYDSYPKKVSRKEAEKSWSKLKPEMHQKIIDDVNFRKREHDPWKGDKHFICSPAVYLKNERWNDEIIKIPNNLNWIRYEPKPEPYRASYEIIHSTDFGEPEDDYIEGSHYPAN